MKRCIITISREYGSGGRLVGKALADDLGIPFYDKEIIEIAAEKSGLSPNYIERNEESAPSSFLYSVAISAYAHPRYTGWTEAPTNDKSFFAQSAAIRQCAEEGSCVIVGRCADYILRADPDLVRLFFCRKFDERVQFAIDNYGLEKEKAADRVKRLDRNRANYYKYYTGKTWGDVHEHDIIINTGYVNVDSAKDVIKAILREKGVL